MGTLKNITGKVFYGAIFMLLLPACLYYWTKATAGIIQLPVPYSPTIGLILLDAGIIIIAWGMLSLLLLGKGLPMNAYPPQYYVHTGIYGLFKHPIYVGAALLSFGLSIYCNAPSGFWLVSPLFCLSMIVYVVGFENEIIEKATGYFENSLLFSLPENTNAAPSWRDRASVFVLALIPWLILYELFIFIGMPKDAIYTNLGVEQQLPVMEWTELFYVLPYLLVIILPFILHTKSLLHHFIRDTWLAMFLAFFIYLAFPFVVEQRAFTPKTFLGEWINWERSYDNVSAALPAFHVIWAFIIAKYFTARLGIAKLWYTLAILIALSCIGNGSHSIPDVLAGLAVYLAVDKRTLLWNAIRNLSETIANSWKEWHWGGIRLINHGLYAGAAAFTGIGIAGGCLTEHYVYLGLLVGIAAIVGAALWAQIVEGSPRLLRPYGYYGSVVGIFASIALISFFFDISFMYLLAAFALAGPWVQVLGRLRCLVQGCCHGKPCDASLGIRFTHPQSRVLKIASLKGVPIHPTQLYSIGSNILIGLLLIRLVSLTMPVSFIAGMYLILNGLARFVEEALRGEPQTAYWKGLRLYQWLALINIVAGAVITCITSTAYLTVHFNVSTIIAATTAAVIATVAYGMDFPGSNKRFARLTS